MSDWAVGDLALCVESGAIRANGLISTPTEGELVGGRIYRVLGVFVRTDHPWAGVPCIAIEENPDGAAQCRFRKIRPDEHEACEPEFVTLLKRTKVRA